MDAEWSARTFLPGADPAVAMRATTSVKNSFVAGLVLVAPFVVTLFILRIVANWALAIVNPIVQGTRLAQYTANHEIAAQFLTAGLILGGIVLLGYIAQRPMGRLLFGGFGRAVTIVPFVGTIYQGVREVAASLAERGDRYESVVIVEYPKEGTYVLGFVTGTCPPAVSDAIGEGAYTVFIPNSPNPTGGRLLLVPQEQVHEIDMSMRRGIRMLISTGIAPDEPLPVENDRGTPRFRDRGFLPGPRSV